MDSLTPASIHPSILNLSFLTSRTSLAMKFSRCWNHRNEKLVSFCRPIVFSRMKFLHFSFPICLSSCVLPRDSSAQRKRQAGVRFWGRWRFRKGLLQKAEMGQEQRQTVGSCPNSFCYHVEVWYIVSFGDLEKEKEMPIIGASKFQTSRN